MNNENSIIIENKQKLTLADNHSSFEIYYILSMKKTLTFRCIDSQTVKVVDQAIARGISWILPWGIPR